MRRPRVATVAVVLMTGTLSGCGETAASYCGDLYENGGTPGWAERDDLFSDYESCVDWYVEARDQVGG